MFIELNLADDRDLDIPKGSVLMAQGMAEGENPKFPKAKVFLHYIVGENLRTALLSNTIDDLALELDINVDKNTPWLKLTKDNDQPMLVIGKNIVSRMALEEGCEITVMVGRDVQTYAVKDTRRQIKKWTERGAGPTTETLTFTPADGE